MAPVPLTDCLNRKLAELRMKRCKPLWIECCRDHLTALVVEGEDDSVVLHPDPSVDRAWYAGIEIRHAPERELTWVFVKGEIEDDEDEVSAHIVSTPEAPGASEIAQAA